MSNRWSGARPSFDTPQGSACSRALWCRLLYQIANVPRSEAVVFGRPYRIVCDVVFDWLSDQPRGRV
jgi:hypothetical protein